MPVPHLRCAPAARCRAPEAAPTAASGARSGDRTPPQAPGGVAVRYVVLKPDGSREERTLADGADKLVEELKEILGGWYTHIEVWYQNQHRSAYVNEEAGLSHNIRKFEFNRQATNLTLSKYDCTIRGNMVIQLGD